MKHSSEESQIRDWGEESMPAQDTVSTTVDTVVERAFLDFAFVIYSIASQS